MNDIRSIEELQINRKNVQKNKQKEYLEKTILKRIKFRKEYISNLIEKRRNEIPDFQVFTRFDKLVERSDFTCKIRKKELFDAKNFMKGKKMRKFKGIKISDYNDFERVYKEEQLSVPSNSNILEISPDRSALLFQESEFNGESAVINNSFRQLISAETPQKISFLSNYYDYSNLKKSKFYNLKHKLIKDKILENPLISLVKLTEYYNETVSHNNKVSRETIRKYVKSEFNYKKIYIKNHVIDSEEYKTESKIFLKKIISIFKNKFDIVYTDESKFTTCHKKYAWILKRFSNLSDIPQEDYSVNISYNLIISTIKNKVIYYELFEENNNAEVFTSYFERLINKMFNSKLELTNYYFYIDNARVHHSKDFRRFVLKTKRIKVIYSIRYTPEFNLCEYVFSILKKFFYSTTFISKTEFCQRIEFEIENLNNNGLKIKKCYLYMFDQILKFLKYLSR